jgi:hypothetical protein
MKASVEVERGKKTVPHHLWMSFFFWRHHVKNKSFDVEYLYQVIEVLPG